MDDAVATRRRVWFGLIMVVAFALLIVGALLPSPSTSLRTATAGADETIPDATELAAAEIVAPPTTATPVTTAAPVPTTEAPATTSTTEAERPTTTTTAAPKASTVQKPVAVAITEPVRPAISPDVASILACLRNRESHGVYTTVSSSGNYRGAYQFNQNAWDSTARHAGRLDLVGKLANLVSPADQDAMALALYQWQGTAPWGGACD